MDLDENHVMWLMMWLMRVRWRSGTTRHVLVSRTVLYCIPTPHLLDLSTSWIMRLRCRRPDTSLVLIVLCSLITAVPTTGTTSTGLTTPTSRDGPPPSSTTTDAAQSTATSRTKADEVSKPAPVDGMDGKPHAGPWVRLGADRASPVPSMDDSAGRKPSPRPLATPAIPKVNDGVMDDPNRETPKKGTTGTEGGVSEKDRHRKAHEGQTGERAEKRPDPPKEAPPLPHSEQEKIRETAAIKDGTGPERIAKLVDQTDPASDLDTTTVSGGLAVSTSRSIRSRTPTTSSTLIFPIHADAPSSMVRNRSISPQNHMMYLPRHLRLHPRPIRSV